MARRRSLEISPERWSRTKESRTGTTLSRDEKHAVAERVTKGAPLVGMIVSAISGAIVGSLITLIICSLW